MPLLLIVFVIFPLVLPRNTKDFFLSYLGQIHSLHPLALEFRVLVRKKAYKFLKNAKDFVRIPKDFASDYLEL